MKKIIAMLLALVMVLSMTACQSGKQTADNSAAPSAGGSSSGDQNSAGGTSDENAEIVMWTFLDPSNTSNGRSIALAQMIQEFEAEHPGVKVTVEPQDWTIMTAKFLAATTTGDAPDIIWCARDELFGVLDAGALEPLENLFLKDWSEEEIADVDDAFFQFGERDGKHYTLTLSKNAVVLYYRADLMEQANLQVPTTWDEMVSVAKALTGDDAETGIHRYGLGMAFDPNGTDSPLLANYLIEKQGNLFTEDGKANWANDVGVAGVQWVKDAIDMGITPAECVNTSGEDMMVEFEAGKYAMSSGGAVRVPNVKSATTFDPDAVQIAPLPGGCILDGWFTGIWSGSQHKELAGQFLEKMYSKESDKLWVELGGQAPVRKSTLDSLTITDANAYLKVMVEAFESGWFVSNKMSYSGWKTNLHEAIQKAITGTDALEALGETAAQFNSANNR